MLDAIVQCINNKVGALLQRSSSSNPSPSSLRLMTVPTRPPTHYGWSTYRLTAQLEPCAYQYLTQLMHHTGDGAYCTLVGDLNILLAPARSGKANILSRSAKHVHAQPMLTCPDAGNREAKLEYGSSVFTGILDLIDPFDMCYWRWQADALGALPG